jgi:erythromycin esterase-like protein
VATMVASASGLAALPGVTELKSSPEKLADAELDALLRAHVAPADVVAIGESVHGSAGFLRIQTRLIRYLVERHGLRLIVWENPSLRSLELSRWVSSCTRVKSAPPIDVLYMPTAADIPLFEWICTFNHAHPNDPIVFRGMDVWDRPWEHYARIRSSSRYVAVDRQPLKDVERCPGYRSGSWEEIEVVFARLHQEKKFVPEAEYETCRSTLAALLDRARQSGKERLGANDPGADDEFELALSASTLLGWLGFYNDVWSDDVSSWNERDRAQGRNLLLLMEKHRAARAIWSAHTSHTSHNRSPADWWGYGDLKSGIHFFAGMTWKRIFNIALTAYGASGTQGEWSLPSAASSMDKALHDAGHAFSFFTASAPFLKASRKWWMQNGNVPGPLESGIEIVPGDHFDAFFFLDRSHLDKALPQRPMWQP